MKKKRRWLDDWRLWFGFAVLQVFFCGERVAQERWGWAFIFGAGAVISFVNVWCCRQDMNAEGDR